MYDFMLVNGHLELYVRLIFAESNIDIAHAESSLLDNS